MVDQNHAGADWRDDMKAGVTSLGEWLGRQGCLFWGFVALIGVWLLNDCSGSDAPPAPDPAAKVTQRTAAPADKAGSLAEWITVLNARTQNCEAKSGAMAKAMTDRFDPYRLYALADEAEAACEADQNWVKQVEPPTWLNADAATSANQTADACSSAAFARKTVARKIKALTDSGMRPSAMREAQLAGDDMKAAISRCAALPIKAALDEGVDAGALAAAIGRIEQQ